MGNLKAERAAILADAHKIVEGVKSAARDLTPDESERVNDLLKQVDDLDVRIKREADSADLLARLTQYGTGDVDAVKREVEQPKSKAPEAKDEGLTIGERFLKSGDMKSLRQKEGDRLADTKNPFHVKAYDLGGLAEMGVGVKATTITTTDSQVPAMRTTGYRSELLDQPVTFLDLVTTGRTDASMLDYARIVSTEDNAAIVPEGQLKPISDLETDKATAKAHVYADGFEVTNQVLADDGALVAFMDNRLRHNVRNVIEHTLINGDAPNGIQGILNTAGVQAQAFSESALVTIARALEKVEAVQTTATAIVMNPADAWALALSTNQNGDFQAGNPFAQGIAPTPFGVRLVKSSRVAKGKAIIGNFSSVHLLEREGLSVTAFNQHKDFAQRNMSYVRAEWRGLQAFYAPREIVVADVVSAA